MTQNIESSEKKRERDRAYARIYRNKNKEAIRERDRIRNENRKDYKRENRKAYYRDNKDKILQKSRDRYLTKREDILEQKRIYRKNNPELIDYTYNDPVPPQ